MAPFNRHFYRPDGSAGDSPEPVRSAAREIWQGDSGHHSFLCFLHLQPDCQDLGRKTTGWCRARNLVGHYPECRTGIVSAPCSESPAAHSVASLSNQWRGAVVKILDRYLAGCFLRGWLNVNLVLAGLLSFLELARQLDDVGKGRFSLSDALLYVALTLPGRMIELAPPSALLGSIIALGLLAKNLELVAIRSCGISIQRIGLAVAKPAVLTLFALLLGAQFITPYLEQTAWTRRETALADVGTILPRGGFWVRDKSRFINLRTSRGSGIQAADIYEFDGRGKLAGYLNARETHIAAKGNWELHEVQQKIFREQEIEGRTLPRLVLSGVLTNKQADALAMPLQTLSLSELYNIIENLEERGQNPGRYRLALWQKLVLPVMTAAMIMISLPFVCGPTRSSSLGWLIMVGAIIGVAFFILNQILGYTGLIFQISPFWTTLFPALAVLAAGIVMTRKTI
ncbi:MAG: LPS export ABC transporter permease LptG [Deltaproteobacteria bacterium]|nr:LPS export ABC transporter permease LptG [Deltaproteobacteria bacterium]